MNFLKKACLAGLLSVTTLGLTAANASASNYPEKQVRWLVPYPAGGGSDFLARTIAQPLAEKTGQTVLVDNKPGGNTSIAAVETARSTPDGYTVLSADNGTMVFNSALYKNLSYDPVKDLEPVTLMGKFPMILIVSPNSGINSVEEFVQKTRENPGKLNYGSAGAGSPHHLAMELLKEEADIDIVHVPYRGAAPSLSDVAGGQVQAMMVDLAAGAGFIKSGKVKALAVANGSRLAQLPEVPTFAEAGYKEVEAAALVGMVATAGTPKDTIASLNKKVVEVINEPAVNKKMIDFGIEPVGNTPEEYEELLNNERERWHKLISDLKITLD
ncbi:MAG: tripartite tricarboxylate transporter substrate binding protein [Advenella sp.]|uniref:Bug family tripartite tricarboxylate transporter substrate binding protein n=1 Tax=Advenella sp. TaxID=1872388 RepID=UPI002582CAC4|nr:tripartite tricarboxylate transporter substrate binding protein [Advenella sp.]MDD3758975.1 tripartite tricarboxylate transporter substrate binding protein [Advenella sp.]